MLGIQKTKNLPENTNAPSALFIGNVSALRVSRGVQNKNCDSKLTVQNHLLPIPVVR